MNNTQKYLITVRFPSWGEENKYPAFGVEYLIEIPFNTDEVVKEFIKKYSQKICKNNEPFGGEILFIKEVEYISL